MTRPDLLDGAALREWLASHDGWRLSDSHLVREVRMTDYRATSRLFEAQVAVAERLDHHPVVTIGYRDVRVELWTHDRGGVTKLDTHYAEAFDEILATRFAGEIEAT